MDCSFLHSNTHTRSSSLLCAVSQKQKNAFGVLLLVGCCWAASAFSGTTAHDVIWLRKCYAMQTNQNGLGICVIVDDVVYRRKGSSLASLAMAHVVLKKVACKECAFGSCSCSVCSCVR